MPRTLPSLSATTGPPDMPFTSAASWIAYRSPLDSSMLTKGMGATRPPERTGRNSGESPNAVMNSPTLACRQFGTGASAGCRINARSHRVLQAYMRSESRGICATVTAYSLLHCTAEPMNAPGIGMPEATVKNFEFSWSKVGETQPLQPIKLASTDAPRANIVRRMVISSHGS
ncbi:hypothetical protein D3C76_1347840 [compost metagenome]